jgi:protein-tyrosine kinase
MIKNIDSGLSIGDIISQTHALSASDIEAILDFQKKNGVKFGEAAVALGLIKRDDVLWALSKQFQYPYKSGSDEDVSSELVVATNPFDAPAEFFRDIRTKLLEGVFSTQTEKPVALAVCSPSTGDGKSFFAANIATAFSQLGKKTLLIDADMRTPRLHEMFGIDSVSDGLSGIISGRSQTNVLRPIESLPNLFLLPVGVTPPNPMELLHSGSFDLLLMEVLRKFDFVIVDTPAASHGSDARVIAAKCGASVIVARKNITKIDAVRHVLGGKTSEGHRLAGVLFNEY